jgi:hypothetical protein
MTILPDESLVLLDTFAPVLAPSPPIAASWYCSALRSSPAVDAPSPISSAQPERSHQVMPPATAAFSLKPASR